MLSAGEIKAALIERCDAALPNDGRKGSFNRLPGRNNEVSQLLRICAISGFLRERYDDSMAFLAFHWVRRGTVELACQPSPRSVLGS